MEYTYVHKSHLDTRKGNILDLVFTNSPNLITDYSTIVNQNFSDHNTLKINLNLKENNGAEKIRKNPYLNKIYEYDLMNAHEEDWIRYDVLLTKLAEDFGDKLKMKALNKSLNVSIIWLQKQ